MDTAPATSSAIKGPMILGLAVAAAASLRSLSALSTFYGDNDDAMRLQEVRDLLSGQNWYDVVQHRMAPPAGLESHWSRLVDAPLASLVALARPFLGQENAEFFMRAVWPPLMFALALWALLNVALKLGGERAAWASAVIAPTSGFLWLQFTPGRIDHHCIQLALAAAMMALACDLKNPRNAALIGALASLSAAIGLESIGVIAWATLLYLLLFLRDEHGGRATRAFGAAFAGVTAAAYLIQTPPGWLMRTGCDSLQSNGLVGIVIAGVGLSCAASLPLKKAASRAAIGGAVCMGAFLAALAMHPSCLHGPYADIDPRIAKNWLPYVEEAASLPKLFRNRPAMAISTAALPLGALIYAGWTLRKGERRENFVALSLLLLIACAIGVIQVRALSFAALVAIPIAAAGLASMGAVKRFSPMLGGLVAGAIASPTILLAVATMLTPASPLASETAAKTRDCGKVANFAPLLNQPRGIVFGDLNVDTDILAATPHSVAGGPYHRIGQAIYDAMTTFTDTPDRAAAVLARTGANYLALCGYTALPQGAKPGSLAHALLEGPAPAWATPLTSPDAPVAIFRIDRALLTRV